MGNAWVIHGGNFYHCFLNVLWQHPQPPKTNALPWLNWEKKPAPEILQREKTSKEDIIMEIWED